MRLFGISSAAYAGVIFAGNSALMADNSERLVRAANEIANAVVPKDVDGRYRFSGRVVGNGPTRRFNIDAIHWSALETSLGTDAGGAGTEWLSRRRRLGRVVFSPSSLIDGGDYKSTISIGSVSAPVLGAGAVPLAWTDPWWRLDAATANFSVGLSDPPVTRSLAPLGGGSVLKAW